MKLSLQVPSSPSDGGEDDADANAVPSDQSSREMPANLQQNSEDPAQSFGDAKTADLQIPTTIPNTVPHQDGVHVPSASNGSAAAQSAQVAGTKGADAADESSAVQKNSTTPAQVENVLDESVEKPQKQIKSTHQVKQEKVNQDPKIAPTSGHKSNEPGQYCILFIYICIVLYSIVIYCNELQKQ